MFSQYGQHLQIYPVKSVDLILQLGVVQERGSETLLCLKEPLRPSTLIPDKLRQESSLTTPISDVPRKAMLVGSYHL
jgi:hypothetical protein